MDNNSQPPSNPNSHPQQIFTQQDIILQIQQTIRSIKSNLPKPNENNNTFPPPSVASNLFVVSDFSGINAKRDNPVQIFPNLIKKRKKDQPRQKYQQQVQGEREQQSNDFDIPADETQNRRITDFFSQKNKPKRQSDAPIRSSIEEFQKNPAIKILKQKLMKKRKIVQDLKASIDKIKQKNEEVSKDFQDYKEKQKNIITEYLTQNYNLKIYQFGKQQIQHNLQQQRLNQRTKSIQELINMFKNSKSGLSKNKKIKKQNGSDQQSNTYLDFYLKDRSYFDKWIKMLQIDQQKIAIMDQFHKYTNSHQKNILLNNTFYYQLPSIIREYSSQHYLCNNFIEENNLALCSLNNNLDQCYYQILTFNLQTLKYQQINLIKYPAFMAAIRKQQLLSFVINSTKKHRMLINTSTILNQCLSQQFNSSYLMIGHDYYENSNTIQHLLIKYQSFPQQICKYIIKFCLKVLQQVKATTDMDWVVSSRRIVINCHKYDIKIIGDCQSELYSFYEYRNILSKSKQYLYYSPEILKDQNHPQHHLFATSTMWSIGILFYQMLTGKKPFDYDIHTNVNPQEFYLITHIVYPPKVAPCKEFIASCLSHPSQRLTLANALKHAYFNHK